jgi:hypothetical protein
MNCTQPKDLGYLAFKRCRSQNMVFGELEFNVQMSTDLRQKHLNPYIFLQVPW